MQTAIPDSRDIVLIGGGHAHALLLRRWGMDPLAGARLTLIDPNPTAPYTGMLPGHVAGHYPRAALDIDLVRLARFAGARLILGRASGIDRERREITVQGRPPVAYDLVSIDIGITSDMPALTGFAEHAVPAKPLGPFADRWRDFLAQVAAGTRAPTVTVIGGGVGGVELSLAMDHALRDRSDRRIAVIDSGTALAHLGAAARRALLARLQATGIALHEDGKVAAVNAQGVALENGTRIESALVVGAAGARAYDWLAATGLALTDGFVDVGETLQSVTDPRIFGVGDCAHLTHAPRPKAGVFAVRQAPVLGDNLVALLTGGTPRAYHPQKDYLKLISLGRRQALADRSGLAPRGATMWRWKDHIDRKFMRKLQDLPAMPAPVLPDRIVDRSREMLLGEVLQCGGCGAKLGSGVLDGGLARIPAVGRADVVGRPGDDAAILLQGDGRRQVVTVDHLREFTRDPYLMARIATIHALGDVWAMGARPQAVLPHVILPPLSPALQARSLAEIMDGIADALDGTGAQIVGGHSSAGAEMTVGLTLTGLCDGAPLTVSGAGPGDVLLLSKPLGSGTLLAAEMQRLAEGAWIEAAFARMLKLEARAAEILGRATAVTDVTGFGLAGHLLNIATASGVRARLTLDAVPLMAGAEALAAQGVRSSLYPANHAAAAPWLTGLPDTPRAALLFDPQTAGGLLAAMPADAADAALMALREAGYAAARIGVIEAGPPGIVID